MCDYGSLDSDDSFGSKLSFTETQAGTVQVIAVDGKPLWMQLRDVQVCGDYYSYGDSGTFTLAPRSAAAEILRKVEGLILQRFLEENDGRPVGTLYMSRPTLDVVFSSALSDEHAFRVNASPGGLEAFDASGSAVQTDLSKLTLHEWLCDVVVQPCWLYVSRRRICLHWRLRQVKMTQPLPKAEVEEEPVSDSDWGF